MKLLLYCNKNKWRLFFDKVKQVFTFGKVKSNNDLNGKIVAECDFEVEEIGYFDDDFGEGELYTYTLNIEELEKRSCVGRNNLYEYLQNKYYQYEGYAIHIKNLHIFDESKELSEYYIKKKNNVEESEDLFMDGILYTPIKSTPQNMMYAKQPLKEDKIIISIKPEELCRTLNGEQDIIIRKKVLKEMVK